MKFVKFFLNFDCKFELIEELGHLGFVNFKDMNPDQNSFQRRFVQDVRRAEELQRILKLLRSAIDAVPDLADDFANFEPDAKLTGMRSLGEIEQYLAEKEEEIKDLNSKHDALYRHQQEVIEFLEVLNGCKGFLKDVRNESIENSSGVELKERVISEQDDNRMQFVAGCIPTVMVSKVSRILARNFRNKVVFVSQSIETPIFDPRQEKSASAISKTVFMCFYHYPAFTPKLVKLVESFSATKYTIPESSFERERLRSDYESKLRSMEATLGALNDFRRQSLGKLVPLLDPWDQLVRVHKGSANALNLFQLTENKDKKEGTGRLLEGRGWVAACDMDAVRAALDAGARKAQFNSSCYIIEEITPGEHDVPPTYWKTNKLSAGYQGMINAYGVARYKELNPAIFSVITFPFMFGVMFGDAGHGFLMALIAAFLIYKEGPILADKKKNEIFGMLFGGRYLLLMMGIFGLYMGTIYNDTFSIAFKAAPSQFLDCSNDPVGDGPPTKCTRPYVDNVVYPFGFDPQWSHASNKLSYQNSVKMKQAIVLGVVHMCIGIFCKLFNFLYYNKKPQIGLIWVPEVVFMTFIFGYLVIIIFIKWGINWDDRYIINNDRILVLDSNPSIGRFHWPQGAQTWYIDSISGCNITEALTNRNPEVMKAELFNQTACNKNCAGCTLWKQYPPSLLDTLIQFFMSMGSVETPKLLYSGQSGVQQFLLTFAFLMLPVLLLGEPLYVKRQMSHQDVKEGGLVHDNYVDFKDQDPEAQGHPVELNVWGEEVPHIPHAPHEFSEVCIHQIIHTIEYALGCISNTASYLRLWALSLAHQQLSEVFWDKLVVEKGLAMNSPVILFATVGMWAGMTFGILMSMEGLSAFLHALRLHWVEFMNKFYFGDGVPFEPFSFEEEEDM